ncbi:hypothetical protein F5882DRAFT_444803 [Hyaloscypha sp. PMI_1271]|nr:hypothetical protein F5882DRAFT_444803 [Hyaloscypha sp. PMI_1271]
MDAVPPTPRIIPTRRTTLFPVIAAPLPTNTPDPSFTLPSFVRVIGRHAIVSPKYDLIEFLDAFCLYGKLADPQTMTIRGHSERSGISPIGLVEGTMSKSATTRDSKPPQAKGKYWLSERAVGEFSRSFKFHVRVDQVRVQASLKNGLLSIVVPKAEKHVSCKVSIS